MFDFGWAELLVIAFIILLAVGPNDIPKAMYQAGRFFRRLHYLRFALTQQFDDFMEKADAEKSRQSSENAAPQEDFSAENAQEEPEFAPSDPENPHYVENDDEIEADSALDASFGHEFDDFADDEGVKDVEGASSSSRQAASVPEAKPTVKKGGA